VTKVSRYAGSFAGDKEAAARIRDEFLGPAVANHKTVTLDFGGVDFATQSFIHALLAHAIREDPSSLDLIEFKNCNEDIQALIEIVVDYAQEDFGADEL
jgi:hypothetical protein